MKPYADEDIYTNQYLAGRDAVINNGFQYYARQATLEMEKYLCYQEKYSEEFGLCCCEVAESIFRHDTSIKNTAGAPMVSYNNDGQSASFDVSGHTPDKLRTEIYNIIRKYFLKSGLLYCGVRR